MAANKAHAFWWRLASLLALVDGVTSDVANPQALLYGKYFLLSDSQAAADTSINTMYLYTPEGPGPFPFVFQVHGGGFVSGGATKQSTPEIEGYLSNGIAYVSLNYRLIGQTYYFNAGNRTTPIEEELVEIDENGSLSLSATRTMSEQVVMTGNQEKIGKCVYDAVQALEYLLHNAAELQLDTSRVGFQGGSAGGGEILYLAFVYPFLTSENGRPNSARYTPRSMTYTMAQIDYPIPMLDRGWGLWANDLGNDTRISTIVTQQNCEGILGQDAWCKRKGIDCNDTWSDAQIARFCGSSFADTTFADMRDSFTWPTNTAFGRGMARLWHHSLNLARLPREAASKFYLLVENTKNGRDPMSVIHSSFWARSYATFAEESGTHFAVYYTDYPGMKPEDKGSARIPSTQAGVFNYRSNFDWRQQRDVAAQVPGSSAEQLLLHCFAFNRTCTVAPPPAPVPTPGPGPPPSPVPPSTQPLSVECKAQLHSDCSVFFGDETSCDSCVRDHRSDLVTKCGKLTQFGERLIAECFVQDTSAHKCRSQMNSDCTAAFGDTGACTKCVHTHAQDLIAACGNDLTGGRVSIAWCASQVRAL